MIDSIKKQIYVYIAVVCIFLAALGSSKAFALVPSQLYDQVWRLIDAKYVDRTNNHQDWGRWRGKYDNKIQTDEDAYIAIETMLASLDDPYTKFLNPKDFAEETSSIKGSLKGIGIQIGVREGKLVIIAPIEDTPGEKAGLLAEDEILEINGESTKGITVEKAADKIRGEEGTTVELLVKRKNQPNKLYKIQRAEIEIKSVSTKVPLETKLPAEVGYIRLSSFLSKNAAEEFSKTLSDMKDKKGYIIDLRSNPGGLLSNAIIIADMFLYNGVIVSTVDRDGYKDTSRSTRRYVTDKPVIILINQGSASASEILSCALQDNQRALIVGANSYGKGLVQEINKLQGGSGINITIQKYLTPNGNDINKKGIKPDVEVELSEQNIKDKSDTQLNKATELMQQMIKNHTNKS